MKATEFTWVQPIGGKQINWKPLTVGDEMDVEANYRAEAQRHLQKYILVAKRITKFGDQVGCQYQDLRGWESADLESFFEEVISKEDARRAAFKKLAPASSSDLEACLAALLDAQEKFKEQAKNVIAAARVAELSGPLGAKAQE